MQGWVKLHRQFTEWEWYTDDKCFRLFIHLLLKCNHKTVKWRGEIVDRGQTITSIGKLAVEVGMTPQTLRTTLKKLESTGEINKQSTSKLTKITVCNYGSYQEDQQTNQHETNNQLTNEQQTTNKPLTTNKNDKNNKNEKNNNTGYAERVISFWNSKAKAAKKFKGVQGSVEKVLNSILDEDFKEGDILKGISNYMEVLNGDNFYYSHQWALCDFLRKPNACQKFSSVTSLDEFRDASRKDQLPEESPI